MSIHSKVIRQSVPLESLTHGVRSSGNEADWIVISVVRTEKVGFLNNMRRTNVMLSRCKRGMVICTSRAFAEGKAKDTLLGKLAKAFADRWVSAEDALQGNF